VVDVVIFPIDHRWGNESLQEVKELSKGFVNAIGHLELRPI
jgi:hypothetical protein